MIRSFARRHASRPRLLRSGFSSGADDDSKGSPRTAKPRSVSFDRSGLLGSRSVREGRFFLDALKDVAMGRAADSGGITGPTEDERALKELAKHKEPLTPLAADLRALIQMKGPISLHEFVSQVSNHFQHGYYQNTSDTSNNKIGDTTSNSDFVTAPEISQLFGEMVALWCLQTWENMGRPSKVRLIELGPGKGTLTTDLLRTAQRFPAFHAAIDVFLVELSDAMRKQQRAMLGCDDADITLDKATKIFSCPSKHKDSGGKPIHWCRHLNQVPSDDVTVPTLIVGQEFLDTFPVHQFVYTTKGWREKLVDVDNSADNKHYFRLVISPNATPATMSLLREGRTHISKASAASGDASAARDKPLDSALLVEGDGVEISPLALAVVEDAAAMVKRTRGACLFIDYGEALTQADSLRGFKRHGQVSALSEPGLVDVTADVGKRSAHADTGGVFVLFLLFIP